MLPDKFGIQDKEHNMSVYILVGIVKTVDEVSHVSLCIDRTQALISPDYARIIASQINEWADAIDPDGAQND